MSTKILLENVRLSFENLFVRRQFVPKNVGQIVEGVMVVPKKLSYQALLLIPKTRTKDIEKIRETMTNVALEKNYGKDLSNKNKALVDGDEDGREEHKGHYYVRGKSKDKPVVVRQDKTPIKGEDNLIFSGCYVDAIIDFWFQKPGENYVSKINCNLYGVMLRSSGPRLGALAENTNFDNVVSQFNDYSDQQL